MRGKFIVIDGVDGAGKTTEIRLLKKEFSTSKVLFTYEPGGSPLAEGIRKMLVDSKHKTSPVTDFLLFWAARASHVHEKILPALTSGKHVISDRFDSSTFAYQVVAEGHADLRQPFSEFRKVALGTCVPDAYIFLDMNAVRAIARRREDVSKKVTHFDKKPLSYHEKVRQGFKRFKPGKGSKIFFVNADRDAKEVHGDVLKIIRRIIV